MWMKKFCTHFSFAPEKEFPNQETMYLPLGGEDCACAVGRKVGNEKKPPMTRRCRRRHREKPPARPRFVADTEQLIGFPPFIRRLVSHEEMD
jgi:hypothetical protein